MMVIGLSKSERPWQFGPDAKVGPALRRQISVAWAKSGRVPELWEVSTDDWRQLWAETVGVDDSWPREILQDGRIGLYIAGVPVTIHYESDSNYVFISEEELRNPLSPLDLWLRYFEHRMQEDKR